MPSLDSCIVFASSVIDPLVLNNACAASWRQGLTLEEALVNEDLRQQLRQQYRVEGGASTHHVRTLSELHLDGSYMARHERSVAVHENSNVTEQDAAKARERLESAISREIETTFQACEAMQHAFRHPSILSRLEHPVPAAQYAAQVAAYFAVDGRLLRVLLGENVRKRKKANRCLEMVQKCAQQHGISLVTAQRQLRNLQTLMMACIGTDRQSQRAIGREVSVWRRPFGLLRRRASFAEDRVEIPLETLPRVNRLPHEVLLREWYLLRRHDAIAYALAMFLCRYRLHFGNSTAHRPALQQRRLASALRFSDCLAIARLLREGWTSPVAPNELDANLMSLFVSQLSLRNMDRKLLQNKALMAHFIRHVRTAVCIDEDDEEEETEEDDEEGHLHVVANVVRPPTERQRRHRLAHRVPHTLRTLFTIAADLDFATASAKTRKQRKRLFLRLYGDVVAPLHRVTSPSPCDARRYWRALSDATHRCTAIANLEEAQTLRRFLEVVAPVCFLMHARCLFGLEADDPCFRGVSLNTPVASPGPSEEKSSRWQRLTRRRNAKRRVSSADTRRQRRSLSCDARLVPFRDEDYLPLFKSETESFDESPLPMHESINRTLGSRTDVNGYSDNNTLSEFTATGINTAASSAQLDTERV
ncbi:MAG: hypothetical protein MHM6MM_002726 [Cercozoa sp. M6MM]